MMKIKEALVAAALALCTVSAYPQTSAAFLFDASNNSTITPPFTGSGLFTFAVDPGNGTHPLTSLGAFSMSFVFGPMTYTEADIVTPLAEILVILTPLGPVRRLQFSNVDPFGSGPHAGSIDLEDGAEFLSFEPPGFGGDLDRYIETSTDVTFGTYEAIIPNAIPEPSTYALMLAGLGLVGLVARRRRRSQVEMLA